jgi:hypothetical protein
MTNTSLSVNNSKNINSVYILLNEINKTQGYTDEQSKNNG